ncbi:MAG TPA: nitrile hydratase subunit alpha [Acidimicrobiia bacterium]|nr:nitrile hydratase subunit alpha [Acidimicrobiia bacterium]
MSGNHPDHPHMQDFEGHVRAVESDLEYFRRKRIDSRIYLFLRRGIISFADLFRGHEQVEPPPPPEPAEDLEHRIRALEDSLDAMILEIATTNVPLASHETAIDDGRVERGDYNPEFRLAIRSYDGDLETKIGKLEQGIAETRHLIAAFTRALLDRGEVAAEQLDQNRQRLSELGYRNGARIVARAWVDPEFKQRLIGTGREAVRELDIPPGRLGKLGIAENTDEVHNIVVCTLCSCYPHDLLGNPPWWYRTDEYKQQIVADPRRTIADMFGLVVDDGRKVVVHDSTSDVRWMVLPRRPEGTEGMSEEELAELVTIDSMVGSAEIEPPRVRSGV